ncbi:MAG TPA: DUF763 domain-containing protein [Thermodesulfobacteriota bacterium]|nr:DUF763 domain-containing protein [Thermodesulfobacteriota bacterium]
MKTGVAHLPLHYGKAPVWLFQRMKSLAREITLAIIDAYGTEEILSRLSDPFWFQAFGCLLGFDWHSSGVTTTVCGALKEGIKGMEKELGLFIAGGKGRASRKTPVEIEEICSQRAMDGIPLIYASRMSAKVDSAAVQDGYQIYHHTFFFTQSGNWAVVQQGMNEQNRYARRYHWFSQGVKDFVCEPHWAVCCDQKREGLNLVARESERARQSIMELSNEKPEFLISEGKRVNELYLPKEHSVPMEGIRLEKLEKIFIQIYEHAPKNFEGLLGMRGVGPKSLRALSLISELIYGAKPSFRDPTRFSFAHGGKDGHPYPVDRKVYDKTIEALRDAIDKAKVGNREKMEAVRRLRHFSGVDSFRQSG